jgi:hypothetical protein
VGYQHYLSWVCRGLPAAAGLRHRVRSRHKHSTASGSPLEKVAPSPNPVITPLATRCAHLNTSSQGAATARSLARLLVAQVHPVHTRYASGVRL